MRQDFVEIEGKAGIVEESLIDGRRVCGCRGGQHNLENVVPVLVLSMQGS